MCGPVFPVSQSPTIYDGTMRIALGLALAGLLGATSGCRQVPQGFESPEPGERIHAVTDAARTRDESSIPHLITLLRSDDPLVRMTSIRTLELLTGQTLSYDHAGSEASREVAIQRWVDWQELRAAGTPAGDLR
jgi:hypothetical protein